MKSILASLAALTFVLAGCAVDANDPTPEQTPATEPAPAPASAPATEQQPANAEEHTGKTTQAMVVAGGEDCPAPCYTWIYGICKYNGSCTHN